MRLGPVIALAVLAVGSVAGWYWLGHAPLPTSQTVSRKSAFKKGGAGGAPVPVVLAAVKVETVPVYRQGIGNVAALNNVTIKSQVDGKLVAVEFVEGQDVKKGQVLARIDPTLYQAQFDQAQAKKAQDEANLVSSKLDLDRYQRLAKESAGPKQQADQQAAAVKQLEAQIKSDQAAIDSAKATLGYTTIVSPFDGRIGLRAVDPGNVVHASDSGGLATLAQVKPISVVFSLPQRDLAVVNAAIAKGDVTVEALQSGSSDALATGKLAAVDNQIDLTTGTFKVKATFANDDLKLWPGQFVSTRVIVDTLREAATVPTAAIRRGSKGTYVYVVDEAHKAHVAPVELALQDDVRAVIAKGVAPGANVVTVGFAQLTDGARVMLPGEQPRRGGTDGTGASGKGGSGKGAGGKPDADAGTAATTPANAATAVDGSGVEKPRSAEGKAGKRKRRDANSEPKSPASE